MAASADDAFQRECLQTHNTLRAQHGCPPLEISKKLTDYAKKWAQTLAKQKKMKHSSTKDYGENLYMIKGAKANGEQAAKAWYDEIKAYNFKESKFSMNTGHFTQLIWKETKELGVGVATVGDTTYVVCSYYPPGNVQGAFKENVPPKQQQSNQ